MLLPRIQADPPWPAVPLLPVSRPPMPGLGPMVPGLPVPAPGPGVCRTCHGPAPETARSCWCCRTVTTTLGHGCPPVVVGCCYRPGDRAHAALRGYKDASVPAARRRFTAMVAATVASASTHLPDVGAGAADAVCPVPPSRCRQAPSGPVQAVVGLAPPLCHLPVVALRREPSALDHLRAARGAFQPMSPVSGLGIVVVDDTWTTGAQARSAAAALAHAGARVLAIVVAGRCVDPTASPVAGRWWQRVTGEALGPRHRDRDTPLPPALP